jgi:hypothetical protein
MIEDPSNTKPPSEHADRVPVTDLNQFVHLLAQWHRRKVQALEHLLQIPEGFKVQIGDEPEFEVTDDIRKGFLLGIELALMEFGTLPFSVETEDDSIEQVPVQ